MDKRLNDYTKINGYSKREYSSGAKIHYLDGERLDSPSRLLSPISKITLEKIPEEVLRIAIERGSAISDAVELMVQTSKLPEIDLKYVPIFKQLLLAIKELKLKPLEAEYFIINEKLKYCGFIDLICEDESGDLLAVEIKTRDLEKYPRAKVINHLQNNYYAMVLKDIPFKILSLDSKGRNWAIENLEDMKKEALEVHAYWNKFVKPEL